METLDIKFIIWQSETNDVLVESLSNKIFGDYLYDTGETFVFDPFVNAKDIEISDINVYRLHKPYILGTCVLCESIETIMSC